MPELDLDQLAVSAAVAAGGHHVVHGAPGSGKTRLAVALALDEARRGGEPLLLVPSRTAAGELRDEVTRRLDRTTSSAMVRTPASLAYAILRLRARHLGEPAPTLITGPEQDQVLAELLAGHAEGEGPAIQWPEGIGPQTWSLQAFRAELRDLLMRAAEAGLDGADLTAWGHRYRRPEWVGAGQILTEYTQVTALGQLTPDRGARYDAASIVDEAVAVLRRWQEEVPGVRPPTWSLVVHDDFQDATLATARLLGAIAEAGARLAVIGDADASVQSFRGGVPSLLATAALPGGRQDGAWGAIEHVLGAVWRHGEDLREPIRTLSRTLPVLSVGARRDAPGRPTDDGSRMSGPWTGGGGTHPAAAESAGAGGNGSSRAAAELPGATPDCSVANAPDRGLVPAVLGSAAQEVAYVARELREARLRRGVPWSKMAVIARSGAQLGAIRRGLRTAHVPLMMAAPDRPLRDEPAVRPLLMVLRAVLDDQVQPEAATDLLTGPIGGLDAVSLRGLRRVLRQRERAAGGERHSGELLCDLLADPDAAAVLPSRHRSGPRKVAQVLTAGCAALAETEATVETVLWAIWQATSLATTWQKRALEGGPGADRADADLDAVMTLFRAAEQFVDRTAGATPATFVEHLAAQDFPADSLAARGEMDDAVAVHTAASAAGGEWDVVAVVGVQEDVWPDLRIRDTLLGAAELADLASARHAAALDPSAPAEDATARSRRARRDVADGELRTFVAACSRARQLLYLTAVLDADARPSVFFDVLGSDQAEIRQVTRVPAPLDLRGLVGQLRAALRPVLTPAPPGPDANQVARASDAAAVLSHLSAHEVAEADPAHWGVLNDVSTSGPLTPPEEVVTLSPSAVELATTCPLRWLLTRHGGEAGSSGAQNLGILIHDIAAEHPHGTEPELMAALEARWDELDLGTGWFARNERARAEQMIRRLATYLQGRPGPVRVEVDFTADVGEVRLRGRVDRVEEDPDGALHIVDLKTSKTAVAKAEAEQNPQLGSYQVAAVDGAFGPGANAGASLVYLGTGANATVRRQPSLETTEDPDWAGRMLADAGRVVAAGTFEARPNKNCARCPVRTSCPAVPDGGRVTGGAR